MKTKILILLLLVFFACLAFAQEKSQEVKNVEEDEIDKGNFFI
jgi:hypothetical protein